ncbi:MFS transporter [Nocardia colli]|uniref:MFS transporter n=1 Tax=Nocardia colli TaxID=2545717 RepID=UPI00168D34C1|nr:MFS transporter [Nocardia colli]
MLTLAALVVAVDTTVLAVAVPSLTATLHPDSTTLLWINDIYGFVIAATMIAMGSAGDRIGHRTLLISGAACFAVASAFAAAATTTATLILARAVLGSAAAMLTPATLALIPALFGNKAQRSLALSVWMGGFVAGYAIGPVVGGVLLQRFWWGSVFVPGAVAMVLVVAAARLLPQTTRARATRPDLISTCLSLAAVLLLVFGFKQVTVGGEATVIAGAILAGAILATVFVRRQRTLDDPLIDPIMLRSPAVRTSLSVMALNLAIGPIFGFLLAQYLQSVLGMSPLRAGLWMLPSIAGMAGGLALTSALSRRRARSVPLPAAYAAATAALALLTVVGRQATLPLLASSEFLYFFATTPVTLRAIETVLTAASTERSGAASALSETAQELGGALGLTVFGSIAAAVYRRQLPLSDIPAAAAERARSSVGSATALADQLPAPAGEALAVHVRDAFTTAIHTTAAVAAAALAIAAIVSRSGEARDVARTVAKDRNAD